MSSLLRTLMRNAGVTAATSNASSEAPTSSSSVPPLETRRRKKAALREAQAPAVVAVDAGASDSPIPDVEPQPSKRQRVTNPEGVGSGSSRSFRCSVWDKSFLDELEDYEMLDSLVATEKDREVLTEGAEWDGHAAASIRRSFLNASVLRHFMTVVSPQAKRCEAAENRARELEAVAERARELEAAAERVKRDHEEEVALLKRSSEEEKANSDRQIEYLVSELNKVSKAAREATEASRKSDEERDALLAEVERLKRENQELDEKRVAAEVDATNINVESFANAMAQLQVLNPNLETEGASHNHLVRNGCICRIVNGEIVPL